MTRRDMIEELVEEYEQFLKDKTEKELTAIYKSNDFVIRDYKRLDMWLLDNEDISQEERELIINALIDFENHNWF